MSTAVMTGRITESSPRFKARIAGALYLVVFFAAPFAEFFARNKLVVYSDAAATAANILAHQALFRWGFVAQIITLACDASVALIFYELLKPVSRMLSLFAAVSRLMFVAIMAANLLNYFAPLALMGGTQFKTDQLQALVLASQTLYASGYGIAMVFFGFHCLFIGYLIFRSAFFPRILGPFLAIAGLCYVTNSFANFLAPAFAAHLFPYIMFPAISELFLTLWLLVKGVNVQRWKEQASAAGEWRSQRAMQP
jgi:hypothetical protein